MAERLRKELFLLLTAALALLAVVSGRVPIRQIGRVEDWSLLLLLLALILSVEIVRDSRLLDHLVSRVVTRFSRARTLTLALFLFSGVTAAVVTNDVALFVVIPFTISAAQYCDFRVRNAVILEIIAANLLGCLTPIGNPQNLFLFGVSGMPVRDFLVVMAPFCTAALAFLIIALFRMEPGRKIQSLHHVPSPMDPAGATLGVAGVLLVILEIVHVLPPWVPALFAVAAAAGYLRGRIKDANLSVVLLFFFVFIVIAAIRTFNFEAFYASLPLPEHAKLVLAALLFPQVISNVPAAILLAPLAAGKIPILLRAINAGGCGTIIASLANLLGWQIYSREAGKDRVFLHRFTLVSFIFLIVMGGVAFLMAVSRFQI